MDFPGALQALRKRQKKGEKGRFRPISGKGGQTPLKPPFVTPPFAAAQMVGFRGKKGQRVHRTSPRTLPWNFIAVLLAPLIRERAKGQQLKDKTACRLFRVFLEATLPTVFSGQMSKLFFLRLEENTKKKTAHFAR